jgi:hypothetical protein
MDPSVELPAPAPQEQPAKNPKKAPGIYGGQTILGQASQQGEK